MEGTSIKGIERFREARRQQEEQRLAEIRDLSDAIDAGYRCERASDLVTVEQICRQTGWSKAFVDGLFITGVLPGFRLFGERVAKKSHWKHVCYELRRLSAEGANA